MQVEKNVEISIDALAAFVTTKAYQQVLQQYAHTPIHNVALKLRQHPNHPYILHQIEAFKKSNDKFKFLNDVQFQWLFGSALSIEQASSDFTANVKYGLVSQGEIGVDLTCGAGIDSFFLHRKCKSWYAVDSDAILARCAMHNFSRFASQVQVLHTSAEQFVLNGPKVDICYIDPYRRDSHGSKVVDIHTYSPDVTQFWNTLQNKAQEIWVKVSPMTDISALQKVLPGISKVITIGYKWECKELLVCCSKLHTAHSVQGVAMYPSSKLDASPVLLPLKDKESDCSISDENTVYGYLYESHPAISKFKVPNYIACTYGLCRIRETNTLFLGQLLRRDFPGRVLKIKYCGNASAFFKDKSTAFEAHVVPKGNIETPNYFRKKYKIKEGDLEFMYFYVGFDKKIQLIWAQKLV